MKRFKKFLAEDITTASTGGGSSQKDQTSKAEDNLPKHDYREWHYSQPVGPGYISPSAVEFIEKGEPRVEDYKNPLDWRAALERYWRLYFRYFGLYRYSPDMAEQIAKEAYERWLNEQGETSKPSELDFFETNPIPERENYSSEEEYQRAFEEWVEKYERFREA